MIRRTTLLLAVAAAAGCRGQLPGGAEYQLITAGGNSLPIELRAGECADSLYGGSVALDGDGGYRSQFQIRRTCPDSVVGVNDPGTTGRFQVRNDTAYFFEATGARAGSGLLSGDSLVVQGPIHRLVYRRK